MKWLGEEVRLTTPEGNKALDLLLSSVKNQRGLLLEANRRLRELSLSPRYGGDHELLRSVPGVGLVTAMALLVELEDISRFPNSDNLAGYMGLVPMSHSSGEKDSKGEMTFRGQAQLREKLIECAWISARVDPALAMSFNKLCQRMEPDKAITRIATVK
ncbi:MAG: IS110 family transposase [Proteiniphilum sp.]